MRGASPPQPIEHVHKLPHFDVIIYDQLKSPILWVEDNPDSSTQGKSQAIPAEHVMGIIEIKSHFGSEEAKKAVMHLLELKSKFPENKIYSNIESQKYLPKDFFSAIVFFDLDKKDEYKKTALNRMVPKEYLHGYFGGLILNGESLDEECAGGINLMQTSDDKIKSNVGKRKGGISLLDNKPHSNALPIQNRYFLAEISWSDTSFNSFAFKILDLLDNRGLGSEYYQFRNDDLI